MVQENGSDGARFEIPAPYLLLVGDAQSRLAAKTAVGVAHWRPEAVAGQLRFSKDAIDLGVPDMDVAAAARAGVRTLMIGIAPSGGRLPEAWVDTITSALRAGLDVASGLHVRLADHPAIAAAQGESGRQVMDVRFPRGPLRIGTGARRSGKRVLAVGVDCAVGKMFTTLAIDRALRARGVKSDFRATGQTGIFIAGAGICVDAVISDFVAGEAERLSPDNAPEHWDVIEGQGSLFHPAYAGVSLGLLHGSQPDALVMCGELGREHLHGVPGYRVPDLQDCIDLNLSMARLTNPDVRCVGIAVNSSRLPDGEAGVAMQAIAAATGLPCVDPVRTGVEPIVDCLLTF